MRGSHGSQGPAVSITFFVVVDLTHLWYTISLVLTSLRKPSSLIMHMVLLLKKKIFNTGAVFNRPKLKGFVHSLWPDKCTKKMWKSYSVHLLLLQPTAVTTGRVHVCCLQLEQRVPGVNQDYACVEAFN